MLSDSLFDGIKHIEKHQQDYPELYDDIKPWVEAVKRQMKALLEFIELPIYWDSKLEEAQRKSKNLKAKRRRRKAKRLTRPSLPFP